MLDVGYDVENLTDPERKKAYTEPVVTDRYGRRVPKAAHGSQNLGRRTSSTRLIVQAACDVYDRITDPALLLRRFSLAVTHLVTCGEADKEAPPPEQLDLFTDYEARERERETEEAGLEKERRVQKALLDIRDRYGKNAVVKGLSMQEGATGIERNKQVGGHRA